MSVTSAWIGNPSPVFGVRAGPIQRDWERLRTPGESTETITQGTTLNPDGTVNVTSSRTRTQENPLVRAINTEDTAVFSADGLSSVALGSRKQERKPPRLQPDDRHHEQHPRRRSISARSSRFRRTPSTPGTGHLRGQRF